MTYTDSFPPVFLNAQYFPDPAFRAALAGRLFLTEDELIPDDLLENVDKLDLSSNFIDNLEGIGYFRGLRKLNVAMNSLHSLDVSKLHQLERLNCDANYIQTLTLKNNNKLSRLSARQNRLEELDLSGAPHLTDLYVQENRLSRLDASTCPELRRLAALPIRLFPLPLQTAGH